jgi:hypothetical protein
MRSCLRSTQHQTFREVYAVLAGRLGDEHLSDRLRRYDLAHSAKEVGSSGDTLAVRTAAEVLAEAWPYAEDRSADADAMLHEELCRIEQAWAALAHQLRAACKRRDEHQLAAAWRPATLQLFPFPTAVMIASAVVGHRLDSRCWGLLSTLTALAAPQMALTSLAERSTKSERFSETSLTALEMQKQALVGHGWLRKEQLFRNVRFRTRERKLRRGSSAFATSQPAPPSADEGASRGAWRYSLYRMRKESLLMTDGLNMGSSDIADDANEAHAAARAVAIAALRLANSAAADADPHASRSRTRRVRWAGSRRGQGESKARRTHGNHEGKDRPPSARTLSQRLRSRKRLKRLKASEPHELPSASRLPRPEQLAPMAGEAPVYAASPISNASGVVQSV